MVMIEPAPYITGLVEALQAEWRGSVKVVFISAAATQPWVEDEPLSYEVLPVNKVVAYKRLRKIYDTYQPSLVHVAGWGHHLVIIAMILARLRDIKVVASSDTWVSSSGLIRKSIKRVV